MTSTVFESGSYSLEARGANGCAGTDTVVVNVNTPPTVVVKLNGKTLTATDGSLATKVNTCVQSVLLPFGENFEDSLYVWTQATTDQLDWTFNSGATNNDIPGLRSASGPRSHAASHHEVENGTLHGIERQAFHGPGLILGPVIPGQFPMN